LQYVTFVLLVFNAEDSADYSRLLNAYLKISTHFYDENVFVVWFCVILYACRCQRLLRQTSVLLYM